MGGLLVLFLIVEKAFSSTLLRIMLAVGLSYMAFFCFFFLMCLKHVMVLQSIFIDAVSYMTLSGPVW